jgi:N-acetylmuramoyl-L-alanine amidase
MTCSPQLLNRSVVVALAAAVVVAAPAVARAQSAATLYERAQAREATARQQREPAADTLRSVARAYENIVRRYPTSGYCDNSLWQAAGLMVLAYERTGDTSDRQRAERYLDWLRTEYPHAPLVRQIDGRLADLTALARPAPVRTATGPALLRRITQTALPRGDRITIELSHEVQFSGDRVDGPDRLFFDFANAEPGDAVSTGIDQVSGRLVDGLRIGRHPNSVTRVVLELSGDPRYSAFPLYDPFRLVIDVESDAIEPDPAVAPSERTAGPPLPTPEAPAATSAGDYSLARQLGLGVSRVVIDAGHGGHDPGARANGLTEADLVLDVAKRVESLLAERPEFDIVLTRRSNAYIPLEERTAIANREDADLFLSIHVNASRRTATRGIETYFLNIATNPEAEAVAARENATSSQTMGALPDILRAIVRNNKLDESRELATLVQTSMVRRLRTADAGVKDLGVKQAPFVVLIGAQMPSVLAEVSFLTNRAEASLLRTDSYRQGIAEALADAVVKYQASLKKVTPPTPRDPSR